MREDNTTIRYLQGKDVGRYTLSWSGQWLKYGPWLSQPREISVFTRPRVIIREVTGSLPYCLHATYVKDQFLNNKSVLNVLHHEDSEEDLLLLEAILNSKLISVFYKARAVKGARRIFPKIVIRNLREFPYPKEIPTPQGLRLIEIANEIKKTADQRSRATTPADQTRVDRLIDDLNQRADHLVYQIYGLDEPARQPFELAAEPWSEADRGRD